VAQKSGVHGRRELPGDATVLLVSMSVRHGADERGISVCRCAASCDIRLPQCPIWAYVACTVIDRPAQLYLTAERAGMGFSLARVRADFDLEPNELFDPEYMRALLERGVAAGRDETSWIRQRH
jgi:hypothetical protein